LFSFSYFRADAIEIERLEKEARQLTLQKAELEHAEKRQTHDGQFIYSIKLIIQKFIF
jgi:hypothetical protein